MERRRIRDESDARASIALMKSSGMAPTAWCRAAGIDGRSLRAWTMNLARGAATAGKLKRPAKQKPVQLVELVPSRPAHADARYVVRVGSYGVEVSDQFDATTLRRLLAVLTSC
jgi:hypothetical protein